MVTAVFIVMLTTVRENFCIIKSTTILTAPLIIGNVEEDDVIKERIVSSDKEHQIRFLIN